MSYNLSTRFDIGDKAYTIRYENRTVPCPLCQNGKTSVESSNCPCCHGEKVIKLPEKAWVTLKDPMKISRIRFSLSSGCYTVRYKGKCGVGSVERGEDNLFPTYKKAVERCNFLNRTHAEVEIANIKITSAFSDNIPSTKKIAARIEEHKSTGTFKTEIILKKDMVLVDGYTTYLCCKMFGIEKWTVGILGNAQEECGER